MKWKTKPVIVEAVQWTGNNEEEFAKAFGVVVGLDSLTIGSFIKRTEKGRLEVLSEDAFYKTHERNLVWEDNI